MAPILAYWDLRGIVWPIRLLLSHAGVRHEFKTYASLEEWMKDKAQLAETIDFPNLPYYVDGKVQLSQSRTILAYLGKKHNLHGTTDDEHLRMSLIMDEAVDLRKAINAIAYPPKVAANPGEIHENLRKEFVGYLPQKLGQISKFLGDHKWMAGERLTYVDFALYDILDFIRLLFNPKHFNAFPNLVGYMKRFENLEGIKGFLEKNERLPTHSAYYGAHFGHTKDFVPKDD